MQAISNLAFARMTLFVVGIKTIPWSISHKIIYKFSRLILYSNKLAESLFSVIFVYDYVVASNLGGLLCKYLADKEALLLSDGINFSVRKDMNGMYLLDGALRGKCDHDGETLKVEMPLSEV